MRRFWVAAGVLAWASSTLANTAQGPTPTVLWSPEWWLVVGTILLVAFTAALWRATRQLVQGADRNAERQLKAYVNVLQARCKLEGTRLVVIIDVKNYGQTPAYDITPNAGVAVGLSWAQLPPAGDEIAGRSMGVLGPGATYTLSRDLNLIAEHFDQIEKGSLTLFAHGEIRFRDAFEKPRVMRYRVMFKGGAIGSTPVDMYSCREGNEAD